MLAVMQPVFGNSFRYEMRRVACPEDWDSVHAIRFAALSSRGDAGFGTPQACGDAHDRAPNTSTFLLLRNGRPVGCTRSSVTGARRPAPLPAMDVFGPQMGTALGPDATVVEASFMLVDPRAADPTAALFHLFKAPMLACAIANADWLVAAVRDVRMGFYRRMLNMEILSGAETLPGLAAPRVLMGLRFRQQALLLARRIPLLAMTGEDERRFEASGEVSFGAPRSAAGAPRRSAAPSTLVRD